MIVHLNGNINSNKYITHLLEVYDSVVYHEDTDLYHVFVHKYSNNKPYLKLTSEYIKERYEYSRLYHDSTS